MHARVKKHVLESPVARLEKFRLYETSTMYYLVGTNELETAYRLIKINRTITNPKQLSEVVREDPLIYSASDMSGVLDMIHEGNKTSGGLVKICTACGIVGFVKFLNGYYLTLITQRKEVGCIAGNYIYTIKATEMFAIKPRPQPESNALKSLWKSLNKRISQTTSEVAENRYLGLFQFIDMTKDFFFSYSYDLTHSLQYNYIAAKNGNIPPALEMFEWNYYQINELRTLLGPVSASQWTMPIIHGSFQQKRFSQLGSTMDLMLLARRSRHYAGTRYLKRGLNVSGKVANDCEVEQILQYDDGADYKFCAYVQMRGSIPTYWYQETSVTMPKPPILINRVDPDYLATQEHFSDMFRRYGSPIIVLDLVKQHERRPRESIVGREYRIAVETVNECISMEHKIRYLALDYSKITSISKGKFTKAKTHKSGFLGMSNTKDGKERATAAVGDEWNQMEKSLLVRKQSETPMKTAVDQTLTKFDDPKNLSSPTAAFAPNTKSAFDFVDDVSAVESRIDVLRELEDIASLAIQETGFFCNTMQFSDRLDHILDRQVIDTACADNLLIQSGVLRTNCIDCLDRTNGGQFAVGLYFLRVALYTLGLRSRYSKNLEIHKDPMLLMLMEMYGEMADKIALQYGGSEAHKKVIAGKSSAASKSKQNELLTSIKRYYSNAFTDMVKQDAMNIFLGCFIPSESSIPLWDLESDYYLHNLTLHPPHPLVYDVLYWKVGDMMRKLEDGSPIRLRMDGMVKKMMQWMVSKAAAKVAKRVTDLEDGGKESMQEDRGMGKEQQAQDEVLEVEGIVLTAAQCEKLLKRYYMRFLARSANGSGESTLPKTPSSSKLAAALPPPPSTPPASRATAAPATATSTAEVSTSQQGNAARRRNPISSTVQALTRLERRRVMRSVIAEKVLVATQSWWREAIDDYRFGNSLHFQSSSLDPAIYYRRAKEWNLYADARDEDRLPSESYFSRFYRPHELTELDNLLQMDCFAVTEVSHRVLHSSTDKSAVAESGAKDATPSEKTGNAGGGGGGDASLLANIFYFPGLLSATVVGGKPAAQNANGEGENENVEDLAPEYTEAVQVLRAAAASAHNVDPNDPSVAAANALDLTLSTRSVSQRPSHRGVEMREDQLFAYDIPLTSTSSKPTTAATAAANDPSSGLQDSAQVNAQSSGFTLGRVVREIGMKARNIVGSGFNFLRRDDGGNSSDPLKRTSSTAGNRLLSSRASTDLSWITQADASISKASYSMYQQYAASYADSTLLLFDRSAPMWKAERAGLSPLLEEASIMTHSLYDSFAVSEEYRTLLKDHVIHLDDVANMEQLARDAHLAREITKGVYAGLPQSYSATLAVGFLQLSMVWVEGELLRWSDALEPSIITSTSTAATGNAPGLPASHARVFHSPFPTASQLVGEPSTPPRAGAPGTVPPINTTNEQSTERLGGLGGFHDHAERREQVARALSSQIASRLQERVRECVAQQNRVRFSNFRQHLLVSVEPIEAKIGVASNSIVVAVATGLENELRKIVNNHLFQQYTYSKEISADRLSLRLAGYTSAQTVTAYISQFDTDLVASDWDTMIYMLKDSPSYYMGFKEVHALQPQLHATLRLFQHKKRAYLAEQEKKRQPSADDSKKKKGAEGGEGAADEDKEMRAMRRQSYRKVRLTQAERERELRTPQRSGSIYSSRYGLPPGPGLTQTPSQASQSISSQLGIYNAILEEDLRTDFTSLSLDYTASLDAATSSYPFAVFPYQPEPYRIADHDYQGFAQLSQDLYARSTNPHLHLNEVAVRRFQDALLRQEKAALDDLVPAY